VRSIATNWHPTLSSRIDTVTVRISLAVSSVLAMTTCNVVENTLVSEGTEVVAATNGAGEGGKVNSGVREGSATLAFDITSCAAGFAISTVGIFAVDFSNVPQADASEKSTNRETGNASVRDSALLITSTLFPSIPQIPSIRRNHHSPLRTSSPPLPSAM
jgi:hypothetical protein